MAVRNANAVSDIYVERIRREMRLYHLITKIPLPRWCQGINRISSNIGNRKITPSILSRFLNYKTRKPDVSTLSAFSEFLKHDQNLPDSFFEIDDGIRKHAQTHKGFIQQKNINRRSCSQYTGVYHFQNRDRTVFLQLLVDFDSINSLLFVRGRARIIQEEFIANDPFFRPSSRQRGNFFQADAVEFWLDGFVAITHRFADFHLRSIHHQEEILIKLPVEKTILSNVRNLTAGSAPEKEELSYAYIQMPKAVSPVIRTYLPSDKQREFYEFFDKECKHNRIKPLDDALKKDVWMRKPSAMITRLDDVTLVKRGIFAQIFDTDEVVDLSDIENVFLHNFRDDQISKEYRYFRDVFVFEGRNIDIIEDKDGNKKIHWCTNYNEEPSGFTCPARGDATGFAVTTEQEAIDVLGGSDQFKSRISPLSHVGIGNLIVRNKRRPGPGAGYSRNNLVYDEALLAQAYDRPESLRLVWAKNLTSEKTGGTYLDWDDIETGI